MEKLTKAFALLLVFVPMFGGAESGPVSRAIITTAINSEAEPVSNLSTVDSTVGNVMFYTEVVGLSGSTIAHRWMYQDRVIATINMKVRGNSSRTWSKTSINNNMLGSWEAQVLDANGQLLASRQFQVTSPREQSVQKRVLERYDNDCEVKLQELEEDLQADPDSTYLKFLRDQQASRCN